MSAPAMKFFPEPVSTTALTSSAEKASDNASVISLTKASDSWLTGGLFMLNTAIPFLNSTFTLL